MNGTITIYSPTQQAMLPLAGLVVSPVLSVIIYLMARRRLSSVKPLKSRAHLFYLMLSGNLAGQFIGHTNWTSVNFMSLFVAVGFFLLFAFQEIMRICNTNPNLIMPADTNMPDDIGLNKGTMEIETFIVSHDVTNDDFARVQYQVQLQWKDTRKRQWMLGILFVLFFIVSFTNGLYLIYSNPQTELDVSMVILCYYVNCISMSVCIYGSMIHAHFHVTEETRPRLAWWILGTFLWSIIFFSSSLMVLTGAQYKWIEGVIHNEALVAFYGVSSGAVLMMQIYYHNRKDHILDKRDVVTGIIVFALSLAQSMFTSRFL